MWSCIAISAWVTCRKAGTNLKKFEWEKGFDGLREQFGCLTYHSLSSQWDQSSSDPSTLELRLYTCDFWSGRLISRSNLVCALKAKHPSTRSLGIAFLPPWKFNQHEICWCVAIRCRSGPVNGWNPKRFQSESRLYFAIFSCREWSVL